MRISSSFLLIASLTLGACGGSLNPGNWFGRGTSQSIGASDTAPVNPLIPQGTVREGFLSRLRGDNESFAGQQFGEIVDLTVERKDGGAIILVTGRADRQGVYSVQLTPINEDETPVDGVLTYRLEGLEPKRGSDVGSPTTREVTVARSLTDQQLRGVRTIRVEGERNARVARR